MAGIVLAGGKSERMGRDKALLELGVTSLLERAVRNLKQVARVVLVVADCSDKYLLSDGTPVIGDMYPGTGPLGGILTGIEALGIGCHLVVACDMPWVEPDVLRLLLKSADGYDAAIPCLADNLEPLCAAYQATCVTVFREILLCRVDFAVHKAIEKISVYRIDELQLRAVDPDLRSFMNVNTLEDYVQAQSS
jgi:molybdopterin-guanine dinucleotide biosynthesis protein A